MIALISFILVLVGCANWLTIGILQFDFVAGLFGSQANIFSRIVYFIIGIASIIVTINLIKNKGKLTFNLKKLNKKTMDSSPVFVPAENESQAKPVRSTETSSDMTYEQNEIEQNSQNENNQSQSDTKNNKDRYAEYRRQFGEYARDMSHKTASQSPVTHEKCDNENNIEDGQ